MNWIVPSLRPLLREKEVHIWLVDLTKNLPMINTLISFLSKDEMERAEQFTVAGGLEKFTLCRGILRYLLSIYLNLPAKEVFFQYNENGKPFIEGEISFSLSHSRDQALIGIAKNFEIGIDLEYKRPLPDLKDLCERYFSEEEAQTILKHSVEQQLIAFYETWVRKEAYAKTIGGRIFSILRSMKTNIEEEKRDQKWVGQPLWINCDYVYALASQVNVSHVRNLLFCDKKMRGTLSAGLLLNS